MNFKLLAVVIAVAAIAGACIYLHTDENQIDTGSYVTNKINDWTWTLDESGEGIVVGVSGSGTHIYAEDWPEGYSVALLIHATSYTNVPNLQYLELPEGLTIISSDFLSCPTLKTLVLPSTFVGSTAFYNAESLTEIIPAETGNFRIVNGMLLKDNKLIWIEPESRLLDTFDLTGISGIGEYAFKNCTAVSHIEIPDTVKSIESGAFEGCTNLKSISIPMTASISGDAVPSYTQITIREVEQTYQPANHSVSRISDLTYKFTTDLEGVAVWVIDGQTYSGSEVQYTFPDEGEYTIQLTIYGESGITHQTKRSFVIEQESMPDEPVSDDRNTDNHNYAIVCIIVTMGLILAAVYACFPISRPYIPYVLSACVIFVIGFAIFEYLAEVA